MPTAFEILSRLQATAPNRLSGTPGSEAARDWILAYLRDAGFAPVAEPFQYQAAGGLSRAATLLNAWATPILGFLATSINPWVGLSALAALNVFDFVLAPKIARAPQAEGVNLLVGLTRPWAELEAGRRPQVLVTAHHDTARAEPVWMSRLLSIGDTLFSYAAISLATLILFWLSSGILGLWPGAALANTTLVGLWDSVGRWVMVGLCLPIALSTSLWTLRGLFDQGLINPGADDNGSGVAVALQIAPELRRLALEADFDAALLIVDSEEVGLRGTRDFVNRHGPAFDPARTTIINLDSVGRGDTLVTVKGQGLFRQRRADPELLALWDSAAAERSTSRAAIWMTFFTGGTDQDAWLARGFRRALSISHGVVTPRRLRAAVYRAFGIVADPVDVVWSHLHSPADSLDGISPAALAETADAVIEFVKRLCTEYRPPTGRS